MILFLQTHSSPLCELSIPGFYSLIPHTPKATFLTMPSPEQASENDVEARKMKKRAHDRRAQRAARDRTRNRIAHLEATVAALSQPGSDERNAHLMDQLSAVVKDRDELAGILSVVEAAMKKFTDRGLLPSLPSANINNEAMHEALNQQLPRQQWAEVPSLDTTALDTANLGLEEEEIFGLDDITNEREGSANCQRSGAAIEQLDNISDGHAPILPTELIDSMVPVAAPSHSQELILPCSESPCDCSPYSPVITAVPMEHGNIWRSANAVLSEPIHLSEVLLHYEEAMSEDLAVRVIVDGWEEVERTIQLPPLWKKLRKIDQLQFGGCSEMIRLAVLSTMHLLLRFYANSSSDESSKLPPWLHQR